MRVLLGGVREEADLLETSRSAVAAARSRRWPIWTSQGPGTHRRPRSSPWC